MDDHTATNASPPSTIHPDSHAHPSLGASWRSAIAAEWKARRASEKDKQGALFPLAMNPFGEEEILAMTEVLLSGRLTLGSEVERAEKRFADMVGVPFAVMVNSGSSANLLAIAAIANKLRPIHCEPGDQVLVPAVCWSTSVFPLLQNGLCPVFVDADPRTFNITVAELERKLTPRVKAVMAVHVLGNSTDMRLLMDFVTRHRLMLVEDTCESLGSFCLTGAGSDRRMLGTFGDFGTFSFYFSHHITSGEGGMIVCRTEDDYNLLRCLRAHGWTRHLTNRPLVEEAHPDIDPRFLFVNVGYNVRPLEVQGAMLSVQIDKLPQFNACRRDNLKRIREVMLRDDRFLRFMSLMEASPGVDPAWFGVGALLNRPYAHQRREFLTYLEKNGIENRPIISGNFIRQPCIAAFCERERPENYPGAEAIHTRGFFFGIHQLALDQAVIEKLVEIIFAFPFHPQHVVLVTGSEGMLGRYVLDVVEKQALEETTVLCKSSTTTRRIQTKDAEWIFVTRNDGDLRSIEDVSNIFKRFQPTRILHCAAHHSSVEDMSSKPVDFWLDNVTMNNNLLKAAFEFQAWSGPIKVVSTLSTEMCAQNSSLLIDPTETLQKSYAFAQLSLVQLIQWYRQQHGCSFISVLPKEVFGAYGDESADPSQWVHPLISRIMDQKEKNPTVPAVLMGTPSSECEILFGRDLAEILLWVLDNYDEDDTLLVTGRKVSLLDLAQRICEHADFAAGCSFDNGAACGDPSHLIDGLLRLRRIDHPFETTSLSVAVQETLGYYMSVKFPLK